MMFSIVALVYIIMAGETIGEPLRMAHRGTFHGLASCQEHLTSEQFKAERAGLAAMVEDALLQKRKQADAEDQPLPAVTITASCEPDQRV